MPPIEIDSLPLQLIWYFIIALPERNRINSDRIILILERFLFFIDVDAYEALHLTYFVPLLSFHKVLLCFQGIYRKRPVAWNG